MLIIDVKLVSQVHTHLSSYCVYQRFPVLRPHHFNHPPVLLHTRDRLHLLVCLLDLFLSFLPTFTLHYHNEPLPLPPLLTFYPFLDFFILWLTLDE